MPANKYHSVKAGAAHIAFTAPSRTAVRDFYATALNAGGRPNGAPAARTEESGHFNAAVLDFDGNSIEVVFRDEPDVRDDGTVVEHSRVITWQRSVAESVRDDRSVVSSRSARSISKQALVPAPTKAPSLVSAASTFSKAASMVRSASAPVTVPQITVEQTTTTKVTAGGDGAAKKIIGTLLGAAAGAAVAYAMVKSEEDSAKKEAEFAAYMDAKARAAEVAAQAHNSQQQPRLSMQDPQPIYDAPSRSVHRNIETESQYSSPPPTRSMYVQRAIEPAPQSYHEGPVQRYHPSSYTSIPPTQMVERRAIEYNPAPSLAPSRSKFTAPQRSVTSPELLTIEKARSTVSRVQSAAPSEIYSRAPSKAPSAVHSTVPSTLISSFVAPGDQMIRRSSEGSVHSHHSSKSKARSHVSKHGEASKHSSKSKSRSRAPSPLPAQQKAASVIGSILGRDAASNAPSKAKSDPFRDEFEIEELDFNDTDTVAPSDSISNAGSSSRRRSHRSHRSSRDHDSGGSEVSKHSTSSRHSSHSKHSKSSKHSRHSNSKKSHHSRHNERGEHEGSPLSQEWHEVEGHPTVVKPSVISEPSDASTIKPLKSKSGRKDSVNGGQYDAMFNDKGVSYGSGSIASLPIRGITPSMIDQRGDAKNRSVISYAMGQKLRPFEG